MKFKKEIEVRWQDCDPNRHVRHSAYYDYGAHIRIRYFAKIGFDSKKLEDLKIGPIIFKEECSFIKELNMDDTITINLLKGAITENGYKWILHHEIFNQEGIKCAHLTLSGAWMDLEKRKLTIPPKKLAEAFHSLPEGANYVYTKKQ